LRRHGCSRLRVRFRDQLSELLRSDADEQYAIVLSEADQRNFHLRLAGVHHHAVRIDRSDFANWHPIDVADRRTDRDIGRHDLPDRATRTLRLGGLSIQVAHNMVETLALLAT